MKNKNKGGRPKGSGIQEQNILLEIAFFYIRMEKNGNVNKFKFATAVKELGLKPKIKIEEESFIRRLRRKWNYQKDKLLLQARALECKIYSDDTLKDSQNPTSYYRLNEELARNFVKVYHPIPKLPKYYSNLFKHTEKMNRLLAPHKQAMEVYRRAMQPLIDANKNLRISIPKFKPFL